MGEVAIVMTTSPTMAAEDEAPSPGAVMKLGILLAAPAYIVIAPVRGMVLLLREAVRWRMSRRPTKRDFRRSYIGRNA